MEAPSLPDDLVERLQQIRPELELRWNPRWKVRTPGVILADGGMKPAEWEARWELWQREGPDAPEHLIMVCRDENDGYKHPGDWLVRAVELMRKILEKAQDDPLLLVKLMEEEEELKRLVAEKDWDSYCGDVAVSMADYIGRGVGNVPDQIHS